MKSILYIFVIITSLSSIISQELQINQYNGETKIYEIENIDSLSFFLQKRNQDIQSPDSVFVYNLNCQRNFVDTVITIKNSGDKELLITHVKLTPLLDFSFIGTPPTVMSLSPQEEYDIKIRFYPREVSVKKSSVLEITSNAESGLYKYIYLEGKKDSLSFDISNTVYDLGDMCFNSSIDSSINITNTGDGDISILVYEGDSDGNLIDNLLIGTGQLIHFNFTINTGYEAGAKNTSFSFIDNCGQEKNCIIRYNVIKPDVAIDSLNFIAKLGEVKTQNLSFINNSADELIIDSIIIDDNQFELVNENLPLIIAASTEQEFQIKYTPISDEPVYSRIHFKGRPCDFTFTSLLIGDPNSKVYILNEDFEDYEPNEFPVSGGWIYQTGIDSLGFVTDTTAKSGTQCLYIEGVSEPNIRSYYLKHRLDNPPDKIFVEAWIMINHGHAGSGIFVGGSEGTSYYAGVSYGNHEHFFSTLGTSNGTWEDKPKYYFTELMKWTKLSFEFDKFNKTQKVYINDYLVYEDSCSACSFGEIESVFLFASQTGSFIDDVKVWYYENE